jgi:hypothetical protein
MQEEDYQTLTNENADVNVITFKDLAILKQFVEKGFRNEFFQEEEKMSAIILHTKLKNILLYFENSQKQPANIGDQ